jgi:predicted N-acetyltransferase YhbS
MNDGRSTDAVSARTVEVRPMRAEDVEVADRIMRVAFGTFLGMPEPASFMGDAAYIWHRFVAAPGGAVVAEAGGEVIGSNLGTCWGSFGFFGPLTVRPDFWDAGVGRRLVAPVMEWLEKEGAKHFGIFTFAASPKHVALYQRFSFWPRFLTALMSKPVVGGGGAEPMRFSDLDEDEKHEALEASRGLTEEILAGLDLRGEITHVLQHELGETLFVWSESGLESFAICHCGPRTEGGSQTCYVKFAATRGENGAEERFARLLECIETHAASRAMERIVAGMSTARHEAYQCLLARGFRTDVQGVTMQRPNAAAHHRPGVFVIEDLR